MSTPTPQEPPPGTLRFSYYPRFDEHDRTAVTVDTQSVQLEHVIEAFEAYLCAIGFRDSMNGRHLELVDDDE